MIDRSFIVLMARYNHWQNDSLYAAASGLSDAERQADRGSFFKSIQGTLTHLLWGDSMWMHRFDNWAKPAMGIPDSPSFVSDWGALCDRRREADAAISDWAARVNEDWLGSDLSWFSGAANRTISAPCWQLVCHMFNHQTHHRGQVHAMLTAAGAVPDDTDLMLLAIEQN